MTAAALADPAARDFLRHADPVLARLIDARPDFRPGAWKEELPPLDAFGTLVFQVAGQQLSVASTRAIIALLEERFGGHMPSAAELLAADTQVLRDSGFSAREGQTLRALAQRFVDGRLSDEALARMSDEEVESALTEVPGIGAMVGARVRTSTSPATSRYDVRFNASTDSTTFPVRPSWPRYRTGGALIAASQ
jgi:3-methyladenine DNA glycosylase/8-oxoguanine DNA glycosylase